MPYTGRFLMRVLASLAFAAGSSLLAAGRALGSKRGTALLPAHSAIPL